MLKTVLLVHEDAEVMARLTPELSDLGYDVIGAARTARLALALAAQPGVSLALVGERLAGQRDGTALRQALEETWGIRSLDLPSDLDPRLLATCAED